MYKIEIDLLSINYFLVDSPLHVFEFE